MSLSIAVRRRRLLHRSRYRGCKEADLILGRFADQYVKRLDPEQLARYERLIEVDDHLLLAWLLGRAEVPAEHRHDVFELLQTFRLHG